MNLCICKSVEYTCNCDRTASCAAGKRFPCSALPYAHLHCISVNNLDKLSICPLWKPLMMFEIWPDMLNIKCFHICQFIHKYYCMWISHGYACHLIGLSACHNFFINDLLILRNHRHPISLYDRRSHIHLHCCCFSIISKCKFHIFDIAKTFDCYTCLVCESIIIDIFCHTAYPIAAHLRACPIGIVHFHFKFCAFSWINKNDTIAANAKMPVT